MFNHQICIAKILANFETALKMKKGIVGGQELKQILMIKSGYYMSNTHVPFLIM